MKHDDSRDDIVVYLVGGSSLHLKVGSAHDGEEVVEVGIYCGHARIRTYRCAKDREVAQDSHSIQNSSQPSERLPAPSPS